MIFRILSLLPQGLIYFIGDVLGLIVFKVFGYRRKVIEENLRICFPEFTDKEVRRTANEFGRQFFQVLSETICSYRFKEEDWKEHIVVEQAKKVKDYIREGKTVLVTYGHMTNWEWPLVSIGSLLNIPSEFLYKPLENKAVNKTLLEFREKHGAKGLPKDSAIRYILKNRDKPRLIGLVGDQTPSIGFEKRWLDFMGKETAFYMGLEKIAVATQSPVFFLEVMRTGRGQYHYTFNEIATPPYEKGHTGIIETYVKCLEENIRKQPGSYLWSHRRWKYTRKQDEEHVPVWD